MDSPRSSRLGNRNVFRSSFVPPRATEREEARTNYHAGPGGGTSRRYLLGGLFLTPPY